MGELIFLIVIINFIVKAVKKSNEEQKKQQSSVNYQMPKKTTRTTPAHEQIRRAKVQSQQVEEWSRAKERNKAMYEQQKKMSAMEQVQARRDEVKQTNILERAKANAEADKEDVTLTTMETEHNHSERVSPAVHHHPEDVIPENLLGSVEDLMVKGYDGNLCFERDFVGEAMDMISRFTA